MELIIFCEKCTKFTNHKRCEVLGNEHKCCNICLSGCLNCTHNLVLNNDNITNKYLN